MHLYFMTRGVKHLRNLWVEQMSMQPFLWKRQNLKTKKDEVTIVSGGLRPIELWEYVIPKENRDLVLNAMGVVKEDGSLTSDWGQGAARYGLPMLRKALGASKMPKIPYDKDRKEFLKVKYLGVNVIGYKEDKIQEWEEAGYKQEML